MTAPDACYQQIEAGQHQQRHDDAEDRRRPAEPALKIERLEERRPQADDAHGGDCAERAFEGEAASPVRQVAMGLHDQPGGAEQRIADDDGDAGDDRERCQPVPPTAGIGAIFDRNALNQRPERDALREGGQHRAAGESPVPEILGPSRAPAVLEGDATEDEADDHGDNRRVERRQNGRIGKRKHRHQAAAAQHEPGLVAVPDGRDRIHHHVAIMLLRKEREEDADTEVEPVEDDIGEIGKGDEGRPDECEIKGHACLPRLAPPA
ncbi:hypothetical protein D3C72_1555060 [compost metagenome]